MNLTKYPSKRQVIDQYKTFGYNKQKSLRKRIINNSKSINNSPRKLWTANIIDKTLNVDEVIDINL